MRQLLTFARREPGRPTPTDLSAPIAEVLRLMRAPAPPSTAFEVASVDAPVMVMGDPTHLHQIPTTLFRNAADALPPRPDGWVRLTIADNGPGMSEDTRARLFDPFFTTKPRGKGSGLGLAAVTGLIEEMGGTVAIDSAPGGGARAGPSPTAMTA